LVEFLFNLALISEKKAVFSKTGRRKSLKMSAANNTICWHPLQDNEFDQMKYRAASRAVFCRLKTIIPS
jgi:hypothetical protein